MGKLALTLTAVLALSQPANLLAAEPAPTPDETAPTNTVEWKKLPIDPRYETDFTAYTIPRKDYRLSLVNLDYGLLSNTQVGLAPYLFLFGLANIHAKVTAIQTRKFDVSLAGSVMTYNAAKENPKFDELSLMSYPVTLTASWMLGEHMSLHFGQRWENIALEGAFDFATLSGALQKAVGVDMGENLMESLGGSGAVYGGAEIRVNQLLLGMDYRVNRRGSVVVLLRGYTALNGRIDAGVENATGTLAAGPAVRIEQPLTNFVDAVTSVSYQWTWPHFRMRLGLPLMGKKSLAIQGLVQPFELYWLL